MIQEEIQRLKSLDYPIIFHRQKKPNPDIKKHSDQGLGEKYSLSYKKPQPENTDTLIKFEDLKKVYQPFTYLHSDTLWLFNLLTEQFPFNQDLSGWCVDRVEDIIDFSQNSSFSSFMNEEYFPNWGSTCPPSNP